MEVKENRPGSWRMMVFISYSPAGRWAMWYFARAPGWPAPRSAAQDPAAAQQADAVAIAVHGGDHFIYPDCRPGFIDSFNTMQAHALEGYAKVELYAPYVMVSKADIVADGAKHETPFAETWSCYKGGERHCGRCGTCVERREAFHLAGLPDPTDYEDPDFWVAATSAYAAQEVR